jgi:hypothetical protein
MTSASLSSCHSKSFLHTEFHKPHFSKDFGHFYIYTVPYYHSTTATLASQGAMSLGPKFKKSGGGLQLPQNPKEVASKLKKIKRKFRLWGPSPAAAFDFFFGGVRILALMTH